MKGQICQLCGLPRAGGGQRFCWACLGFILSLRQPEPTPPASTYRYPKPRRRQRPRPAVKKGASTT
jgi:hypothetical protein